VSGKFRILHNWEHRSLRGSPKIVRTIKTKEFRCTGRVFGWEDKKCTQNFVVKSPRKRPYVRYRRRWKGGMKTGLRVICCEYGRWMELALNSVQ
jgi:hypothetical protein